MENSPVPRSRSSIILLGDTHAGKKHVLRQVLQLKNPQSSNTGDILGGIVPWRICTKYYEADVDFHIHSFESFDALDLKDLKCFEACVLVVDVHRMSSWTSLHGRVEILRKYASLNVCLCIGNEWKLERSVSEEEMLEWCLENEYEHVPLRKFETQVDKQTTDDFQETTGIARVVEALECTMWASMEQLKQKKVEEIVPHDSVREKMEPLAVSEEKNTSDGETKTDNNLTNALRALRGESGMEMGDLESFEKLLEDVQSARQEANSLPDEERKERAAEFATRLIDWLGIDDSESDGE